MARSKLQSVIVFICVMAAVAALIYSVQYHREKQKAEAAAQVTRKADQEAAQKQQQAEQLAAAAKAVQDATAEHERFVDKYVDIGISKIAGSQMVAVAVASESRSMNHSVGAALVNRFKTDHVQLTDSFFKPELIADGFVSGRSKPASPGRIKTSQFEGIIISQGPHQDETLTGEPTQIEPATIDINSAPGGMVQPGYCA